MITKVKTCNPPLDTTWETMTCWEKCSSATVCIIGIVSITVWSIVYCTLTIMGITLFIGGCIAISIVLLVMWITCWIEEILCNTVWGIIKLCWNVLFGDKQSDVDLQLEEINGC
jgi:hypothetical protein